MKNKLERVFLAVIYLFAICLVFYSCWSFVKFHESIASLVEQNGFNIDERRYEVVNYYMVNAFVYIVYAILIFMGALLYSRISKIRDISKIEIKQTGLAQVSQEKAEKGGYVDELKLENNNIQVSEPVFEKEDYFNSRRMKIEPFNMATFAIEVYERTDPQLEARGHNLELYPDNAFETDVIVDSEMAIKAVCDVFCWGSSLLMESAELAIIAADNTIMLKLPLSGDDLNERFQNILSRQVQEESSNVCQAVEFIQDIKGNVTIVSEEAGMIKITFPAYRRGSTVGN